MLYPCPERVRLRTFYTAFSVLDGLRSSLQVARLKSSAWHTRCPPFTSPFQRVSAWRLARVCTECRARPAGQRAGRLENVGVGTRVSAAGINHLLVGNPSERSRPTPCRSPTSASSSARPRQQPESHDRYRRWHSIDRVSRCRWFMAIREMPAIATSSRSITSESRAAISPEGIEQLSTRV